MKPLTSQEFARIRTLDGGMATELELRGFDLRGPLWSAHVIDQQPEAIVAVHLDYLRAGADLIETVSYQISARGYAELGRPEDDWQKALRRSVELAEEARRQYAAEDPRPILVAASLGPFGAALHNGSEYHGGYAISFDELVDFHRERLAVLAETEADCVALETIPSLDEAGAILTALEDFSEISAWLSFTCRDGQHVAHGERLGDCGRLIEGHPQILALGINCTRPDLVENLILEARFTTRKPVIVYPNSGEPWDADSRAWSKPLQGPPEPGAALAEYAELARQWYAAGAQAVGGCCRTGPAHVRAVVAVRQ